MLFPCVLARVVDLGTASCPLVSGACVAVLAVIELDILVVVIFPQNSILVKTSFDASHLDKFAIIFSLRASQIYH